MLSELARGTTRWRIERWSALQAHAVGYRRQPSMLTATELHRVGIKPYSVTEVEGNVICTAGWTRIGNLLTNQGGTQAMDATHTRIGVGNGVGSASASDTDLGASAGSGNRWFQILDSAVTVSGATLTLVATVGGSDGNFAWNEFGIDVGNTASGATVASLLFNHKTSIAQGTKGSGQIWAITASVSFV